MFLCGSGPPEMYPKLRGFVDFDGGWGGGEGNGLSLEVVIFSSKLRVRWFGI